MSLSDFNQGIYLVITTEVDKKNASKLADLLLREKLIPVSYTHLTLPTILRV